MQTILRVGGIVGVIGTLLLIGVGARFGIVVAPALICVGVAAGLGIAKWLDWSWYGRQFTASLRTGAVAVGTSAVGALLGLLAIGPQTPADVAARSRLPGLDLAPLAQRLAPLGWIGGSIVLVLVATVLALLAACIVGTLGAASKSQRVVQSVARAHQLAVALSASEAALPVPVPTLGGWTTGTLVTPQYNVYSGSLSPLGAPPALGPAPASLPKLDPAPVPPYVPMQSAAQPPSQPYVPMQSAAQPPSQPYVPLEHSPAMPLPGSRTPSDARPLPQHVNDEVAEAFAAWADQTAQPTVAEDDADDMETAPRAPAASTFLNSEKAKSRRSRKKQNTRDWLC